MVQRSALSCAGAMLIWLGKQDDQSACSLLLALLLEETADAVAELRLTATEVRVRD